MKNIVSSLAKNRFISGAVLIILGVVMFVAPMDVIESYISVVGWIILFGAVIGAIAYFATKKEYRSPVALAEDIIAAIVGLIFISAPGAVSGFLPYIFGLILLINSAVSFVSAFGMRSGRLAALIMSGIGIAAGLFVTANPNAVTAMITRIIGIGLIYGGITNIVAAVLVKRAE